MQSAVKELIKALKPKNFLKLGNGTYLDKEIDLISTEGKTSYDLILIDPEKKTYEAFKPLYDEAFKSLSSRGVILVSCAFPIYPAYQNIDRCGKVWFWLLDSGKETKFINDGNNGSAIVKNKDIKIDLALSTDFKYFKRSVKAASESELISFVKPKRKPRNATADS